MNTDETLRNAKAFYPMIVVPGIVLLLAPSTVDTIMDYFGFGTSLGSLIQVSYFVGGVIGILLIPHLMQRLSVKTIAISQVLLLSVSLLASAISPWYPLLIVFYMFAGFANGILITFPGIYVTRVYGTESHRPQNILYSFFAIGVVMGPLLSELIISRPQHWRWAFVAPALLILPLSIPVLLADFARLEEVERLSSRTIRKTLDFNRDLFIGLVIALLLYIAAESTLSMWLVTFMEEKGYTGPGVAHWILTAMWTGLTVGRWICAWLSKKINPFVIVSFITLVSGVLVLVTPLLGSKWASLILYPAVGLFYSGIYPFLVGYVSWFPTDLSPFVFSTLVAAGAAGSAVLIFASGLINQFGNLSLGMALVSLPVFGVLACIYWLRPHIKEKPAATGVADTADRDLASA